MYWGGERGRVTDSGIISTIFFFWALPSIELRIATLQLSNPKAQLKAPSSRFYYEEILRNLWFTSKSCNIWHMIWDCRIVRVMQRYISCSAKLVCLVRALFSPSEPVLFCLLFLWVWLRSSTGDLSPLPLSQLFVAGALLTLHWSAGRCEGGKRAGNSECSKSRCRPWLNTRAGWAARPRTRG